MDIAECLVFSAISRRALLIEQFLREHIECWPGATQYVYRDNTNVDVKCSCGAQLEIVILTKLVVTSYQPK